MNPLQQANKPIVIMGGAPRLIYDMMRAPKDCVRVSCNWHALKRYRADYMVFMDKIIGQTPMIDIIRRYDVPTISHRSYAAHVVRRPQPSPINTGMFALWLAAQSGQDVYMAGFDLYASGYMLGGNAPVKNQNDAYLERCLQQMRIYSEGCNMIIMSKKNKGAIQRPY